MRRLELSVETKRISVPGNLTSGLQSVAIVVPNYNHAAYLPQSLASIAAQTHPPDEVLIIDDASTDNSLSVISKFIARHPNWQLIKHKVRLGVVAGQNEALRHLKTDWISFLGADDLLHPTYIEKAIRRAMDSKTPNLVCGCAELFGNVGANKLRPAVLPSLKPRYISSDEFRRLLDTGDNYFVGTVCLYRRQVVLESGGFDPSLESLSDGVLGRQLAIRGGFYFIPEVLGYWRLIGTNYSTTTVTRATELEPLLARMRRAITTEQCGNFPARYDEILDRRIRYGGGRLLALNRQLSAADRSERIAALLHSPAWERMILAAFMSMGYLGSIAALTWLTLRARPMSLRKFLCQWRARRAILAATQRSRV